MFAASTYNSKSKNSSISVINTKRSMIVGYNANLGMQSSKNTCLISMDSNYVRPQNATAIGNNLQPGENTTDPGYQDTLTMIGNDIVFTNSLPKKGTFGSPNIAARHVLMIGTGMSNASTYISTVSNMLGPSSSLSNTRSMLWTLIGNSKGCIATNALYKDALGSNALTQNISSPPPSNVHYYAMIKPDSTLVTLTRFPVPSSTHAAINTTTFSMNIATVRDNNSYFQNSVRPPLTTCILGASNILCEDVGSNCVLIGSGRVYGDVYNRYGSGFPGSMPTSEYVSYVGSLSNTITICSATMETNVARLGPRLRVTSNAVSLSNQLENGVIGSESGYVYFMSNATLLNTSNSNTCLSAGSTGNFAFKKLELYPNITAYPYTQANLTAALSASPPWVISPTTDRLEFIAPGGTVAASLNTTVETSLVSWTGYHYCESKDDLKIGEYVSCTGKCNRICGDYMERIPEVERYRGDSPTLCLGRVVAMSEDKHSYTLATMTTSFIHPGKLYHIASGGDGTATCIGRVEVGDWLVSHDSQNLKAADGDELTTRVVAKATSGCIDGGVVGVLWMSG